MAEKRIDDKQMIKMLLAALENVAHHAGCLQQRDFHRIRIFEVATEAVAAHELEMNARDKDAV